MRWLNLKPTCTLATNILATGPPPSSLLYKSWSLTTPCVIMSEPFSPVYETVQDKDNELMINVNVSYATVAELEDGLGQTIVKSIIILRTY